MTRSTQIRGGQVKNGSPIRRGKGGTSRRSEREDDNHNCQGFHPRGRLSRVQSTGRGQRQIQWHAHRDSYRPVQAGRDRRIRGRGIDTTSEGDTILLTAKGRGKAETPTKISFEGETTFQTAAKNLAWLNNVKARHQGTANPVTVEASYRLYGRT